MNLLDLRDLGHRALATFIEAFLGVLLAVALADATSVVAIDASALDAALVGGLASVAVLLKEYARAYLSRKPPLE
jgi:hypothetical protein